MPRRNQRRAPLSIAAQDFLQGGKPRLEVPPLIDAFLESRPPHLLRARGSYASLGLVEFDALWFELEPTEIQDPAHIRLEVFDHVFMLDAKHPSRQHRVPVRHQLDVSAVIPANVLEAVGELLARGKQLLEIRETPRHGFESRIDDLG